MTNGSYGLNRELIFFTRPFILFDMFISKDCTCMIDRKMPRVKQNSMPISLRYALIDSQCSKCGCQLEWSANFKDTNQPKYVSQHCDLEYAIHVDSVKVEMMTSVGRGRKAAKKLEDEPGAIKVAKGLKDIKRKN